MQYRVPVVIFHAHGQIISCDASVIHQNVRSTRLLGQPIQEGVTASHIGHVQHDASAAVRGQHFSHPGSTRFSRSRSDHCGTARGQLESNRATNPARSTCDQRDFIFEVHHNHP